MNANHSKEIESRIGKGFVMVSQLDFFGDDGDYRVRYTVRKAQGQKLYHLIGYENGTVR